MGGKVIAVETDVESSYIDRLILDRFQQLRQSPRQGYAAAVNSHQNQVVDAIVFLDDFMRQAHQGPFNLRRRHQAGFFPQQRSGIYAFGSLFHVLRLIIRVRFAAHKRNHHSIGRNFPGPLLFFETAIESEFSNAIHPPRHLARTTDADLLRLIS